MYFILDLLPFPNIKLPKLKKLRQWSHDQVVNLSHLTNRTSNNVNPKMKTRSSYDENNFPTNGISTISFAIREQKIDPKKDNFGLYALKCDRSSSLANAKRGILLNIPTAKVKTKAEITGFHSMERNHEVFHSCEKLMENPSSGIMYDGATSSASGAENRTKVEPPPRKKKRPTATRAIVTQPKPTKKPVIKHGNQIVMKSDSLEKNDSGLYRIVALTDTAKVSVEEPKKKEHVVTMVKPKVQKAVAVKTKPVQQQVAKVKSYEWNKNQRKASVGNVNVVSKKPHFTKRYNASESSSGSFKSENSVDIFQSNKLLDQRKVFDEFDELFDKSRAMPDLSEVTPETAFDKLKALKNSSSSFSGESGSGTEDKFPIAKITKPSITNNETQNVYKKSFPSVQNASLPSKVIDEVSSKPKIVYEQPKAVPGIIKKKILYYDDKSEFQQLIMNQTQSTTIINNHFNANVLPSAKNTNDDIASFTPVVGTVPISCNPLLVVDATGQFDLNGNDVAQDYQRTNQPKAADTTSTTNSNSNSLRIFSNEGIFVFNL
jgi:hypothetical protein